jgi:CRP-like cAMP-binding protein
MNDFLETISHITKLSPESVSALSGIVKRMELPKGHLLLREGGVCNFFYYIEKGLTRTFYYKDGKDITDWISLEKTIAVSIVSYITRKPDIRNIELLEDSILWAVPHGDLEKLYQQHHEIERLGRLFISNGVVQMQQRFDDLHFATAAERYRKLMEYNPSIIQRVPLGMVASYLGITQETLSRIRAQYV